MGAFGEFLQERLGGTKHDVSTWRNKLNKPKSQSQIDEENKEDDDIRLEQISGFSKSVRDRYVDMNNKIKSADMESIFKTDAGLHAFEKWRNEFIKTL